MINALLTALETSAKYGFTDLILAAGLFGAVWRLLRPKTVKRIDGLEVLVCVVENNQIEIEVRNLTNQTVYVYRPYLKLGHHANINDWRRPTSIIFLTWSTSQAPEIHPSEPCNYEREYLLEACDAAGNPKSPAFIEQRGSLFYRLKLKQPAAAEEILVLGKIGQLTLHLIYGREAKTLQVQL